VGLTVLTWKKDIDFELSKIHWWRRFFQHGKLAGAYFFFFSAFFTDTQVVGVSDPCFCRCSWKLLDEVIATKCLPSSSGCGCISFANQVNGRWHRNFIADESRTEAYLKIYHFYASKMNLRRQENTIIACLTSLRQRQWRLRIIWVAFACCFACFGIDPLVALKYEAHSWRFITPFMIKAVADRLADHLQEYLMRKVVKEIGGYACGQKTWLMSSNKKKYQGFVPAPGYPAVRITLKKQKLWTLLEC